jgi:hypothetical protein
MPQVIIYTNENGGVSVCYPTGELPINEVLAKDCPEGAIIIDASDLPAADDDFFNAWRLVNGNVIVDISAARSIQLERVNAFAKEEAGKRAINSSIGIVNDISDTDFVAGLNAKRAAIAAATTTEELRNII